MKKIMTICLACAITFAVASCCCKGGSPKSVAKGYITAIQKGDYKAALDYTALDQETKDQYLALIQEKGGEGLKDEAKISNFEITDETVDEEAGTATVTASVTYADGHTAEQKVPLKKGEDGKWVVQDIK